MTRELICQAENQITKNPILEVKILSKTFFTLLDIGSPISIFGSNVIQELYEKKLNPKPCHKPLSFLQG